MQIYSLLRCFVATLAFVAAPAFAEKANNLGPTDPLTPVRISEVEIDRVWSDADTAIKQGNLTVASDRLQQLNRMRMEAGFDSMEQYSLHLIRHGLDALDRRNLDAAAFFHRRALELSPRSPLVLVRGLWLARQTGSSTVVTQFLEGILASTYNPRLALTLIQGSIYPLLWAATFGLIMVTLVFFLCRPHEVLRKVVRLFPASLRGYVGPCAAIVLLSAPLCLGPMWVLVCWGILARWIFPDRRALLMLTGTVVFGWGVLIPLQENLAAWLRDSRGHALFAELGGDFAPNMLSIELLEELIQERQQDGVVRYALGAALYRRGEFAKAGEEFGKAESLLGKRPWIDAYRGMVAFAQGYVDQAEKRFKDAEAEGLGSAEFLFNYSKIKFAQMDTAESKRYLALAHEAGPEVSSELAARDLALGPRHPNGYATLRLPLSAFTTVNFSSVPGMKARHDERARAMMVGMSPVTMSGLGILLLLWGWLAKPKAARRVRGQAYYAGYQVPEALKAVLRLIPGGAWVCEGRATSGYIIASVSVALLLPLCGWPILSQIQGNELVSLGVYYKWFVGLIITAFICTGYFVQPEEE